MPVHECEGHLNGRRFGTFVTCRFKRIWWVRRINIVCVLAGCVVFVQQNGAAKWNKKLTVVRSGAVTGDHASNLKLFEEKTQPKFIMLYMELNKDRLT